MDQLRRTGALEREAEGRDSQRAARVALPLRRRVTNRFTRVSFGALIAAALICVLSVASASAQAPPPPPISPHVAASIPPPGASLKVLTRAQRRIRRTRVFGSAARTQATASGVWSGWYPATKVGLVWQTRGQWWERYFFDQGFKGSHLADWLDFYYYNGSYAVYYGTWTRYHQDGCWIWWDVASGAEYRHPFAPCPG